MVGKVNSKVRITAEKRTKAATDAVKHEFKQVTGAVFSLKTAIVAVVGAGGFGALLRGSVTVGDEISKLSKELNSSAEALSEYKFAAESANVPFEILTAAWRKQNIRISEAVQGYGAASKSLNELGLSAQDLIKLKPEDQFEAIAEAMKGVATQADRARIAQTIWEESGVRLTRLTDNFTELREEARRFNATITGEQARSLEDLNQEFTNFSTVMRGAANTIAVQLGPALTSFMRLLSETLPTVINSAGEAIAGFFNKTIPGIFEDYFRATAAFYGNLARNTPFGLFQERFQNIARSAGLAADRIKAFGLLAGLDLIEVGVQIDDFSIKAGTGLGDVTEKYKRFKEALTDDPNAHVELFERSGGALAVFVNQEAEFYTRSIELAKTHQLQKIGAIKSGASAQIAVLVDQKRREVQAEQQAANLRMAVSSNFLGSFAALAQAAGNKYFKWYKGLTIAQAGLDALGAALRAGKAGATLGPAGAFAAYASVAAKFGAVVLAMQNINPSSGSIAITAGGGGTTPGFVQPVAPIAEQSTAPQVNNYYFVVAGSGSGGADTQQVANDMQSRFEEDSLVIINDGTPQMEIIAQAVKQRIQNS